MPDGLSPRSSAASLQELQVFMVIAANKQEPERARDALAHLAATFIPAVVFFIRSYDALQAIDRIVPGVNVAFDKVTRNQSG